MVVVAVGVRSACFAPETPISVVGIFEVPLFRSPKLWFYAVSTFNVQLSMSGGTTVFCFDYDILTRIFRIFVEFELSSPPIDSVSQLRFSPKNPDHLLVAAWDAVRA